MVNYFSVCSDDVDEMWNNRKRKKYIISGKVSKIIILWSVLLFTIWFHFAKGLKCVNFRTCDTNLFEVKWSIKRS